MKNLKNTFINRIKALFMMAIITIPTILSGLPVIAKANNENDKSVSNNANSILADYRNFAENPSEYTLNKELILNNMKVKIYDDGTKAVITHKNENQRGILTPSNVSGDNYATLQNIKCLIFENDVEGFDYSNSAYEHTLFSPEYISLSDNFTYFGYGICKRRSSSDDLTILAIDGFNHVTDIKPEAFRGTNLPDINLSHFTEIPEKTFWGAKSIESINFSGVKKIGENAFLNVDIKSTTELKPTEIGQNAFNCYNIDNVEGLLSIDFSNISIIPNTAFEKCNINNIGNMNKITEIHDAAFKYCVFENSDISIPNVKVIGKDAFSYSNVENIYIPNAAVVGLSYSENGATGVCAEKKADGNFAVSDYAKQLISPTGAGDSETKWTKWKGYGAAFEHCDNLKRLYMPSSQYFGEHILPNITDIWIGNNLVNLGTGDFVGELYFLNEYTNNDKVCLHTNSDALKNKIVNVSTGNNGVVYGFSNNVDIGDTSGSTYLYTAGGYRKISNIKLIDVDGITGAATQLYALPFTKYNNSDWQTFGITSTFPTGLVKSISVPSDADKSAFSTITLKMNQIATDSDKIKVSNTKYREVIQAFSISGNYAIDYVSANDFDKNSIEDVKNASMKHIEGTFDNNATFGRNLTINVPANLGNTYALYKKESDGTYTLIDTNKDISNGKITFYNRNEEFTIGEYILAGAFSDIKYTLTEHHKYNEVEVNITSEHNVNSTVSPKYRMPNNRDAYLAESATYTIDGVTKDLSIGDSFSLTGDAEVTVNYRPAPIVTVKYIDKDTKKVLKETTINTTEHTYTDNEYYYTYADESFEGYSYLMDEAYYLDESGNKQPLYDESDVYLTNDITVYELYQKAATVKVIDKCGEKILGERTLIPYSYGSFYFESNDYNGTYKFESASYIDGENIIALNDNQWFDVTSDTIITAQYSKIAIVTIIDKYNDTELNNRTEKLSDSPSVMDGKYRYRCTPKTYSGYYLKSISYRTSDDTIHTGINENDYIYCDDDITVTYEFDICPVVKIVEISNGIETLKNTTTITNTNQPFKYYVTSKSGYYVSENLQVNDNSSVHISPSYDSVYICVDTFDTKDIVVKYTLVPTSNITITVIDRDYNTGTEIIRSGYNSVSVKSGTVISALAYWPTSNDRGKVVTVITESGQQTTLDKIRDKSSNKLQLFAQVTENCTVIFDYEQYPSLISNHITVDGTQIIEPKTSVDYLSGYTITSRYLDSYDLPDDYKNYVLTDLKIQSNPNDIKLVSVHQSGADPIRNRMVIVSGETFDNVIATYIYDENCEWKIDHIAITTPPDKINYFDGENFDKTGMIVTGTYKKFINGSDTGVTKEIEITDYTIDKTTLYINDNKIIVSHEENNDVKTAEQPVTVTERPIYYNVTYYDTDNTTILKTESVLKNHASVPPTSPVKATDTTDKFSIMYTFENWLDANDNIVDLNHITKDLSLYPSFSEKKELYVKFYAADYTTIIRQDIISTGDNITPPIVGKNDLETINNTIEYSFNKWIDSNGNSAILTNIQNGNSYYPTFNETTYYTITFLDEDKNTILKTEKIQIGEKPIPPIVTKQNTNTKKYTFDKWLNINGDISVDINNLSTNTTVYPSFLSIDIPTQTKPSTEATTQISSTIKSTESSTKFTRKVVIEGILKNTDGTPIANKIIELHSTPRIAQTDSKGYYRFENVEVGEHTLIIKNNDKSNYAVIKLNVATDNFKNDIYNVILNENDSNTEIVGNKNIIKTTTIVDLYTSNPTINNLPDADSNDDSSNIESTTSTIIMQPTVSVLSPEQSTKDSPVSENSEMDDIKPPATGDNNGYKIAFLITIALTCSLIIIFVAYDISDKKRNTH